MVTFIPPLFKFSGDYIVTIGGNETTSSGIQILPSKAVAFVVSEPDSKLFVADSRILCSIAIII